MIGMSKKLAGIMLACALVSSSVVAKSESTPSFASQDEVFLEFQKLQEQMQRIFEKFDKHLFAPEFKNNFLTPMTMHTPKVDIKDKKDHYEIKVDLPGSKDASIHTKVEANVLTIDAKIEKEEEKKGEHYIQKERFFNAYHRAITLPKDADAKKLKSAYKEGVFIITIPKK